MCPQDSTCLEPPTATSFLRPAGLAPLSSSPSCAKGVSLRRPNSPPLDGSIFTLLAQPNPVTCRRRVRPNAPVCSSLRFMHGLGLTCAERRPVLCAAGARSLGHRRSTQQGHRKTPDSLLCTQAESKSPGCGPCCEGQITAPSSWTRRGPADRCGCDIVPDARADPTPNTSNITITLAATRSV